jgi:predicted ribonuclease YlaK
MKFLDTNAILLLQNKAFEEKFIISSITLNELEQIKTSKTKDEETKWAARHILHLLADNEDKYEIEVYKSHYEDEIKTLDMPITDDSKIIICAKESFIRRNCLDTGIFITEDLACKKIAECVGLKTEYVRQEQDEEYTGYVAVSLSEKELARFYATILPENINEYGLLNNQYLLLNFDNKIVDKYKWNAETGYEEVSFRTVQSQMFGKITPIKDDVYQQCALDSLCNNQVTVMRGPAGSGKSYLALGYLMSQLDKGKIDRIIIFSNTVSVRGAAKLGYYPGSRLEKLLDSQIGNFLASKLGSITEVERMTDEGTLMILPASDIRGFDTSGMRAGVYITEGQNTSIDMLKLMLQRIGEDSIVIVEGDDKCQVDMSEYAGTNNGLRRMSQVFRGQNFYGEITLKNVYRSKIAAIADEM